MKLASEEQKQQYLPRILRGELEICLGYTEPGAGSDLASLITRAERDGEDYVITGQKVFTTGAHYCTHIWLLARTAPELPRHKGLSIDRKSTRLNSSHVKISYAVFCLKKK